MLMRVRMALLPRIVRQTLQAIREEMDVCKEVTAKGVRRGGRG